MEASTSNTTDSGLGHQQQAAQRPFTTMPLVIAGLNSGPFVPVQHAVGHAVYHGGPESPGTELYVHIPEQRILCIHVNDLLTMPPKYVYKPGPGIAEADKDSAYESVDGGDEDAKAITDTKTAETANATVHKATAAEFRPQKMRANAPEFHPGKMTPLVVSSFPRLATSTNKATQTDEIQPSNENAAPDNSAEQNTVPAVESKNKTSTKSATEDEVVKEDEKIELAIEKKPSSDSHKSPEETKVTVPVAVPTKKKTLKHVHFEPPAPKTEKTHNKAKANVEATWEEEVEPLKSKLAQKVPVKPMTYSQVVGLAPAAPKPVVDATPQSTAVTSEVPVSTLAAPVAPTKRKWMAVLNKKKGKQTSTTQLPPKQTTPPLVPATKHKQVPGWLLVNTIAPTPSHGSNSGSEASSSEQLAQPVPARLLQVEPTWETVESKKAKNKITQTGVPPPHSWPLQSWQVNAAASSSMKIGGRTEKKYGQAQNKSRAAYNLDHHRTNPSKTCPTSTKSLPAFKLNPPVLNNLPAPKVGRQLEKKTVEEKP